MKPAVLCCLFLLGCHAEALSNLAPESPTVWRSPQPTSRAEWQNIKSLGITKVVKLNYDSEGSDALAKEVGLTVLPFSMPPSDYGQLFEPPDAAMIAKAIAAMSEGHVLVHCTHGEDRTGLVVAIYRVVHDGWTKGRAETEMDSHHFHRAMRGLREYWEGFKPTDFGIGLDLFHVDRPTVWSGL